MRKKNIQDVLVNFKDRYEREREIRKEETEEGIVDLTLSHLWNKRSHFSFLLCNRLAIRALRSHGNAKLFSLILKRYELRESLFYIQLRK